MSLDNFVMERVKRQRLDTTQPLVSLIVPVFNSSKYLDDCLKSIEQQSYRPLEVVFHDDCSTDNSVRAIEDWILKAQQTHLSTTGAKLSEDLNTDEFTVDAVSRHEVGLDFTVVFSRGSTNHGPGYSRNKAISLSSGSLLCHFDSDDLMDASRIMKQVARWQELGSAVECMVGCNFNRYPEDSTPYYTNWLNSLTEEDLVKQQYRECTIICPSWLYTRAMYDRVSDRRRCEYHKMERDSSIKSSGSAAVRVKTDGGASVSVTASTSVSSSVSSSIDDCVSSSSTLSQSVANDHSDCCGFVESTPATLERFQLSRIPEDLYYFLDHLELGGRLAKVSEELVTYRYTAGSWALGTSKQDLARVRIGYLERRIRGFVASGGATALIVPKVSATAADAATIAIAEGSSEGSGSAIKDADKAIVVAGSGACESSRSTDASGVVSASTTCSWETFSIWGYGKDGKKFIGMLSPDVASRVTSFFDVDEKKIGMKYFCNATRKHIPVVHFTQGTPPFVVCVASKRGGGELETNISLLGPHLVEGVHYFHFN